MLALKHGFVMQHSTPSMNWRGGTQVPDGGARFAWAGLPPVVYHWYVPVAAPRFRQCVSSELG